MTAKYEDTVAGKNVSDRETTKRSLHDRICGVEPWAVIVAAILAIPALWLQVSASRSQAESSKEVESVIREEFLNFGGEDLRGTSFVSRRLNNANFSSADLTNADFTDAMLHRTDFSHATMEDVTAIGANFWEAYMRGVDLRGANLEGAFLVSADLMIANLSGANLTRATLTEARITDVDFIGTDLTDADLFRTGISQAQLDAACGAPGPTSLTPGTVWRSGPCTK